jgi:hypothetical protein
MASPCVRLQALGQVDCLHAQSGGGVQVALLVRSGQGVGQASLIDLLVTDEWRAELGDALAE